MSLQSVYTPQPMGPDMELLLRAVKGSLAKLAAAAEGSSPNAESGAADVELRAVERVVRGELLGGNVDRVTALVPGFVFLVILPILGQEQALSHSRRASELVDELVPDRKV